MSAAQPQPDVQQLLSELLAESRPAQPADAERFDQLLTMLHAIQQQPVPTLSPAKPIAPSGQSKHSRRALDNILLAMVIIIFALVIILGLLRLSEWVVVLSGSDASAEQDTPTVAPTLSPPAPEQPQQPVINVYLATPVPQATPEPTPLPAPGTQEFPASFQASPDNGAYLTCFNPDGCNPSGASQSSGGPQQAVVESVRQAPIVPQDFHQAADNSAFVGCLVPGGCNPSPAQPVLPAPGTPNFPASFR